MEDLGVICHQTKATVLVVLDLIAEFEVAAISRVPWSGVTRDEQPRRSRG
jgi:hypothetical protein